MESSTFTAISKFDFSKYILETMPKCPSPMQPLSIRFSAETGNVYVSNAGKEGERGHLVRQWLFTTAYTCRHTCLWQTTATDIKSSLHSLYKYTHCTCKNTGYTQREREREREFPHTSSPMCSFSMSILICIRSLAGCWGVLCKTARARTELRTTSK